MIPTSFKSANEFLGSRNSRNVKGKRATAVVRNGDTSISLVYHNTPVVTWYRRSHRVKLETGGHKSVTTKRRMNQALRNVGVVVWQRNFEWWVSQGQTNPKPYAEGMFV